MGTAAGGDKQLQTKTPAEFFAENRNIAGFDNVRPLSPCACVSPLRCQSRHTHAVVWL